MIEFFGIGFMMDTQMNPRLKSLVKHALPLSARRYIPHVRDVGDMKRLLGIVGGRRALGGPQSAVLEIAHHCNAACAMCLSHGYLMSGSYEDRRDHRDGRTMMQEDMFRRVVDDLASLRTKMLILSGKGEPFVHKKAPEFIRYVKRKRLKLMIYSNGALIDEDRARTLVQTGCDILNVSVNAGTPDTYRSINPKGRLEEVESAVLGVREMKRRLSSSLPQLQLSFVILRPNHLEIRQMLQLGATWGASEVMFSPSGIYAETSELALSESEMRAVIKQSREVSSESGPHPRHNLPSLAKAYEDQIDSGRKFVSGQHGLPCYAGWLFVSIGPDGSVLPCCYCTKSLGNVIDQPFRQVWNGPAYREFREKCQAMEKGPVALPSCECYTNCNFSDTNREFYRLAHPFAHARSRPGQPAVASTDSSAWRSSSRE